MIKKIFMIVIFIISCPVLFIEYKYWTTDYSDIQYTAASGIINNKFEEKYSCGKYERRTCTKYIFVINNIKHDVDKDTYNLYKVNSNITLTKYESRYQSDKVDVYWYAHYIICFTLIFSIFVYLLSPPPLHKL